MNDDQYWKDLTEPLCAGRAVRHFRAADGQRWGVCEIERVILPGARAVRYLVFDSPGTTRCVRAYPANWQELSDAELEAMSWRR